MQSTSTSPSEDNTHYYDSGNFSEIESNSSQSHYYESNPIFIPINSPSTKRLMGKKSSEEFVVPENLDSSSRNLEQLDNIEHDQGFHTPVNISPRPDPSILPQRKEPSQLITLVSNFNTLYKKKLEDFEKSSKNKNSEAGDGSNRLLAGKTKILEEWIRDLNEQNSVLIETVDEMEREAEEKIQILKAKVQKSAEMLIDHMAVIKKYELQNKELIGSKEKSEKELERFQKEAEELKRKKRIIEEKLEAVEAEHASLLTLLTRIRDWGTWDVEGLVISSHSHKHLFDLYPNLPGSEVQTVFTQERAREAKLKEEKFIELQAEFENMRKARLHSEEIAIDREKLISDLQSEREAFQAKVISLEAANQDYRVQLEKTHSILSETIKLSAKNSERALSESQELKSLVSDLKHLKTELEKANNEREIALSEATALKNEVALRLVEMSQMKDTFIKLQAENEANRAQIADVLLAKDKIASLEEQVSFFETKFNETNSILAKKSQIIDRLESQMEHMFEKVRKVETECRAPPQTTPPPPPPPLPTSSPPIKLSPPTKQSPNYLLELNEYYKPATALRKIRSDSSTSKHEERTISGGGGGGGGRKPGWNQHFVNTNSPNVALKAYAPSTASGSKSIGMIGKSEERGSKRENGSRLKRNIEQKVLSSQPQFSPRKLIQGQSRKNSEPIHDDEHDNGEQTEVESKNNTESELASERSKKIATYFSSRYGLDLESRAELASHPKKEPPNKLPPIEQNPSSSSTSPLLLSPKSHHTLEEKHGKKASHLPPLVSSPHDKNRESYESNDLKELTALLQAAVSASGKVINSGTTPESMRIRVRASRTRNIETGGKKEERVERSQNVTVKKGEGKNKKQQEVVERKEMETKKEARPSTKSHEILASLPKQSQAAVVTNWIRDSYENSFNKTFFELSPRKKPTK